MALELVSSAFLSPFMGVLFDRLTSQKFINLFRGKTTIFKQLEELNILLLSADKLLNYAEEKQIEDPKVKKWLDKLKEVVYLAGELMDKIDNEALRCESEAESGSRKSKVLSKLIPSSFNAFDNAVRSEMEEILRSLKFLMDQRGTLGLKESREKRRWERLPAASVEESDVFGRDSVKEAIVESVLWDDASAHNLSVIPIVGIGGIGKTTLALLVYDDPKVKEHFAELRVWVTVSTEFDLIGIAKAILEKVTSRSCRIQEQQEILFRLKEALAKKKFLIVLDDVWNENPKAWEVFRTHLVSGMHGSKIIVTTRSRAVASIMATQQPHYLPELSEEDCWQVFKKHAFNINDKLEEYLDLQEIGRKIVKKCKGLPLAVKSLAGVLHSERSLRKWKEILESSTWELSGNRSNDVLPALWLSYYYLPSYLKRCFAYCAVFPKDYRFKRQELTLLWMAEGFLQAEAARNRMEDVGEQYFKDLISRSLFQRTEYYDETRVVMHDLIHDLAMYVSGEFCFHLNESTQLHDNVSMTRHFSCKVLQDDDLKKLEGMSKPERLHTFIQFRASNSRQAADYLKLLTTIGCLRVLSLRGSNIQELPDSIGNLKNLRYLKLSTTAIVTLPDSICSLYNLETLILDGCCDIIQLQIGRLINLHHLDVSRCEQLRSICWPQKMDPSLGSICPLKQLLYLNLSYTSVTMLPDSICSLYNLRHLNTRGSPLEEMPLHIGNLKDLETLSDFVLSKSGGPNIKALGQFQQLHGRLQISGLENVNDVKDAVKANLKDKRNLNELALTWEGPPNNDSNQERDLLQALQPHKNLREIIISGYGGTCFAPWIGNSAFSKMESMELRRCENCYSLPPLGNLPFLKKLLINDFHGVEIIGEEFYGCDSPFRSLETLRIENMPEWKQWSSIEGNKAGAFPCLKKLQLINCPRLSGGLPVSSHTIESLTIRECGQLETITIEESGNLQNVTIEECGQLEIVTIKECGKLEDLTIKKCDKLEIPTNHFIYASLERLVIRRFQSLECFPLENAQKLSKLWLFECESFESLTFLQKPLPVLHSLHWMQLDGLPKLVSFPKGGLPAPNLKELRISRCENLGSLPEQMHTLLPSLTNLRVEYCPKITSFPEGGLPSNLKRLSIEGSHELSSRCMHGELQRLTPSLRSLAFGDCKDALESFPPEGLIPSPVTAFSILDFLHLKALNSNAFQRLTHLKIINCPELHCLAEESLLKSLVSLYIDECALLEQQYRREKGEFWSKICHIPHLCISGRTTRELNEAQQRQ